MVVDDYYFRKIDTEYKAYILGFIYADGCLIDNLNGRQKRLSISIQEPDAHILNKLSQDVANRDYIIKYSPAQIKKNEQKQGIVNLSSNQLVTDLIRLGCNIRKSQVGMTFPIIDKSLIPHFIRGFFDGDGGITVNEVKNKYVRKTAHFVSNAFKPKLRKRAYFCSTDYEFLDKVLSYIPLTNRTYLRQVTRKQTCYTVSIESQKNIPILYNYLYENATHYLSRKKDKFNMTIKSQASTTVEEGLETT